MTTTPLFWLAMVGGALVYWCLPRGRQLFLFVFSASYIAYVDWKSALCLFVLSTAAYASTQRLSRRFPSLPAITAAAAGGYLVYYKYLPVVLHALSQDAKPPDVTVPLGASYFTFKLIHYVIKWRRGRLPPHDFVSFLVYMFFLPMFAAGPIERFERFLVNRTDSYSPALLDRAATRVVYGLVKKWFLVDLLLSRHVVHDPTRLASAVPLLRGSYSAEELLKRLPDLNPAFVWQFVINQYVAWYLDFSAYCDIAIGLGLLFGVTLCENFDYPFLSTNLIDYWKRYHMSLSDWCQRYVYFPLFGATRNSTVALFGAMMAIGVWHAGNASYLAWGAYQALLLWVNHAWVR